MISEKRKIIVSCNRDLTPVPYTNDLSIRLKTKF